MVSIQLAGDHTAIRFGTRRSAWAAALHAAALDAPRRGQRVVYTHRIVDGVLLAKGTFKAGLDRHGNAATRLGRKLRGLTDLPETQVYLCGSLLSALDSWATGAARTHTRALSGLLRWHAIPPGVRDRSVQLVVPNGINGLADLSSNDDPPICAHDRGRSRSVAGAANRARPPDPPRS